MPAPHVSALVLCKAASVDVHDGSATFHGIWLALNGNAYPLGPFSILACFAASGVHGNRRVRVEIVSANGEETLGSWSYTLKSDSPLHTEIAAITVPNIILPAPGTYFAVLEYLPESGIPDELSRVRFEARLIAPPAPPDA